MSLESQIADLVSASNSLIKTFSDKRAQIDAAVAAAVAAAPSLERTWYVDQLVGADDTGTGTAEKPFASIDKAIAVTPAAGRCIVYLVADYHADSHIRTSGRDVIVRGKGTGRTLRLNQFLNNDDQTTRMGGFWMYGNSVVELYDLIIALPDGSAPPAPISAYYAAFFASGGAGQARLEVRMVNCKFAMPTKFAGNVFLLNGGNLVLSLVGSEIPAALAGRIVSGVAAGTNTASLSNILTNLPTL